MARTRTLEIWHIPKRQNVHQIIGAVELLSQNQFNGKTWTLQRKETFNTKLGRAGLTNNGRPLSPSARRTLEALIKYLGFIYVDSSTTPPTIHVTNAGHALIRKHGSVLSKRRNLRLVSEHKEEILESSVVEHQMAKLQITNPVVGGDCINILLFPFRITLRLLLALEHLTKEELGYIVFSMKKEDEYDLIVEKIKTFRSLAESRRNAEITAFKKTEIGNLTLVQAPTAAYYIGLCVGTGLCMRLDNCLKIVDSKKSEVQNVLTKFKGIKPFDFADNLRLWIDYFGNVDVLSPPISVNVSTKNQAHILVRVIDSAGRKIEQGVLSETAPAIRLPLFKGHTYTFEFYSFQNASKISEQQICITSDVAVFDVSEKSATTEPYSSEQYAGLIDSLIKSKDFDDSYKRHVGIVRKITDKEYRNTALLRGGRLEYLFFKLLEKLKDQKVIDDVVWNGRLDEYSIAYPALGGKEGNPDLYFFVGNNLYVLEVTTIYANAMQWSAEGASVYDHIRNLTKKINGNYSVVGIFCAPQIAKRVEGMFRHIREKEQCDLRAVDIPSFIKILNGGRESINQKLKIHS